MPFQCDFQLFRAVTVHNLRFQVGEGHIRFYGMPVNHVLVNAGQWALSGSHIGNGLQKAGFPLGVGPQQEYRSGG